MGFAGSGTVQNRVEQLGEVVQKLRVFYKDITKKKIVKKPRYFIFTANAHNLLRIHIIIIFFNHSKLPLKVIFI
jgi:hypothetical protein